MQPASRNVPPFAPSNLSMFCVLLPVSLHAQAKPSLFLVLVTYAHEGTLLTVMAAWFATRVELRIDPNADRELIRPDAAATVSAIHDVEMLTEHCCLSHELPLSLLPARLTQTLLRAQSVLWGHCWP